MPKVLYNRYNRHYTQWLACLEKVGIGLRQFSDKGCDNRLPFFIHSEIPTSLVVGLTLSESKVINHKPFSYE